MRYQIQIQDPEDPATYYVFTLHIRRDDMDFWIAGIRGRWP